MHKWNKNNFIKAVKADNFLKYKRVEKSVLSLYNNCLYLMLKKKPDYYHINKLIDWNINYDVYASLCVEKYCASAVKSRKKLNCSSHCMGGGAPANIHTVGRWLMGEGHSWLNSPWPTNDASFASFPTLWVALYGRFNGFFCFSLFCALCNRPEPPLGRALPISDRYPWGKHGQSQPGVSTLDPVNPCQVISRMWGYEVTPEAQTGASSCVTAIDSCTLKRYDHIFWTAEGDKYPLFV